MAEVISISKLAKITQNCRKQGQKIVLAGGCFDILHPGHVVFLEKAKKAGDVLIVLLESDRKVRELKGINRPIYTQTERAKLLSALKAVDYVIKLPLIRFDAEYDQLMEKIRPDVIAVTSKDKNSHHKRCAKLVRAKLKSVTGVIGDYSSSRILDL